MMELVVVVLILSVLGGALVPKITGRMAASRDARRLSDMRAIRDAIEQYHLDEGHYPQPKKNGGFGGWDVSHDGDFIPELLDKGYLRDIPSDPKNDSTFHYRYYLYDKGTYGCQGDGDYYVLGVRTFETDDMANENPGYFRCNSRNWNSEFAYVTGGGASAE